MDKKSSLAQAQQHEITRLKGENASPLERLAILAQSSARVIVAEVSKTQLAFARLEQRNLQRNIGAVTEQLCECEAELLEITADRQRHT